jgi:hypothetical protein
MFCGDESLEVLQSNEQQEQTEEEDMEAGWQCKGGPHVHGA